MCPNVQLTVANTETPAHIFQIKGNPPPPPSIHIVHADVDLMRAAFHLV